MIDIKQKPILSGGSWCPSGWNGSLGWSGHINYDITDELITFQNE